MTVCQVINHAMTCTTLIVALFPLLFLPNPSLGAAHQCDEPFQCQDERLIFNGTSTQIDCWGYKSCSNAVALVVDGDTLSQTIHCGGSFSCYDADAVVAGGKFELTGNTGQIMCEGYHACMRANLFAQDALFCQGSFSCANSMITYDKLNYWKYGIPTDPEYAGIYNVTTLGTYCDASYSCAGAELTAVRSVVATGRHSLWWGAIYSGGIGINLTLTGYEAGYKLNIFCATNSSGVVGQHDYCSLHCQGNGCHETYLHCSLKDGTGPVNCKYECGYDSVCPYICTNGECYRDNYKYDDTKDDGNGKDTVSQKLDWDEADWRRDRDKQMQVLDGFSYDEDYCSDDSSITCDYMGWHGSCFAKNQTIVNLNGSVCCRGYLSCAYDTQQGIDASARMDKGSASHLSHILCDSSGACEKATLTNTNGFVYCGGSQACSTTTITGKKTGTDAELYYRDNTRLYCDGFLACFEAKISHFDWLQCTALDACFSAQIEDVAFIDASTQNALTSATVVTGGAANMTIALHAAEAAVGMKVLCDKGDLLVLECQTAFACTGVEVECLGTCDIKCFESEGFVCPVVTYGTVAPTASPAAAPTLAPTMEGNYHRKHPRTHEVFVVFVVILLIMALISVCGYMLVWVRLEARGDGKLPQHWHQVSNDELELDNAEYVVEKVEVSDASDEHDAHNTHDTHDTQDDEVERVDNDVEDSFDEPPRAGEGEAGMHTSARPVTQGV